MPEDRRKLNDIQLSYVDQLVEENRVKQVFNNFFFTKADSRHPEIAGVAGSFMGSLFTLFTVFILFGVLVLFVFFLFFIVFFGVSC